MSQKDLEIHYANTEEETYEDLLNELLRAYGVEETVEELVMLKGGEL